MALWSFRSGTRQAHLEACSSFPKRARSDTSLVKITIAGDTAHVQPKKYDPAHPQVQISYASEGVTYASTLYVSPASLALFTVATGMTALACSRKMPP